MEQIELYRYVDDGKVVVTPVRREDTDAPQKYRLIADEGMELTDGMVTTECIDVLCEDVGTWQEVEKEISAEEALSIIVRGDVDA